MYKIYYDVNFEHGSKITVPVYCPNSNTTHEKNNWNKIEYGVYTCSKCGCRMTVKTEFKEEKVIDLCI